MTEDAFLQTLRDNPADDTTRRVYADWLDEQDDPGCQVQAGYIRADLELAALPKKGRGRRRLVERRRKLAARLDIDWLATVSLVKIEACTFQFECPLKWENLQPVKEVATLRYCEQCRDLVHYCDTIEDAQMHAFSGHCIAIDARVGRKAGDLEPRIVMGMPLPPPSLRRSSSKTDDIG